MQTKLRQIRGNFRSFKLIFLSTIISAILLSACNNADKHTNLSVTPIASTPTIEASTPTVEANLPPLFSNPGMHEVLHLGNTPAKIITTGGTFDVTHPYTIFVFCKGSGKLNVAYTPQGKATFECTKSAQLQSIAVGTPQNPPRKEPVQVTVTSEGNVLWEVSVQVKD
jgi:hypothetical protein